MKTYIIIPVKELTESMIEDSLNDIDTLRLSVDKTLAVLKFSSKYPDCVAGYIKYSVEELAPILDSADWNE